MAVIISDDIDLVRCHLSLNICISTQSYGKRGQLGFQKPWTRLDRSWCWEQVAPAWVWSSSGTPKTQLVHVPAAWRTSRAASGPPAPLHTPCLIPPERHKGSLWHKERDKKQSSYLICMVGWHQTKHTVLQSFKQALSQACKDKKKEKKPQTTGFSLIRQIIFTAYWWCQNISGNAEALLNKSSGKHNI